MTVRCAPHVQTMDKDFQAYKYFLYSQPLSPRFAQYYLVLHRCMHEPSGSPYVAAQGIVYMQLILNTRKIVL